MIEDEITKEIIPPTDTSRFQPMGAEDVIRILEPTIKQDNTNKLLVFLGMLNAYTEENQMNIAFIAPSSTGKSHIPLEVSLLFPSEDLIKLGNASPTAFFHERGVYDKETNTIKVDLERKIVIFLDQPNTGLLEKIRALLSHDDKEIASKITDKSEKHGMRTKTIIMRGYSTFVFCTAGLRTDEQESTRFLLLSPEITQEKIKEAVLQKIKKSSDSRSFARILNANPERQLLMQRIRAIKEANVYDIKIQNEKLVEDMFFSKNTKPKPRDQRDIAKIINIIKSFALLNYWFRDRDGLSIVANEADIKNGFAIWDSLSESQSLSLPPYVHNIYKDVIVSEYKRKNPDNALVKVGLSRGDLMSAHYKYYNRTLSSWDLRGIVALLETAGLIYQESDVADKRRTLIYPTFSREEQNNGEVRGGETDAEKALSDLFPDSLDLDSI